MNVNQQKSIVIHMVLLVVLLFPACHQSYLQAQENRIVREYLVENGLVGLPQSRETIVRVVDQVRKDFNIDEASWTGFDRYGGGFLRHDTEELLQHREGLCGEGSRVVINLLDGLGYNATRVGLFSPQLRLTHALVSVRLGEKEFLVDSINSFPEVNEVIDTVEISPEHFPFERYRQPLPELPTHDPRLMDFIARYPVYSYEAVPYTKLLYAVGVDTRVIALERPSHFVSMLAEKPHRLKSFLFAGLGVSTWGLGSLVWMVVRRRWLR